MRASMKRGPLVRFNRARRLLKEGRRLEAIGVFQELLAETPENVDVLLALANVRLKQQSPDEAKPLLAEALKFAPDRADVRVLCSVFEAKYGSPTVGIAHAERAVEIAPDSAEAAFALANTRTRAGQFAAAIPAFERALEIRPDWTEARSELLHARRFASASPETKPIRLRLAVWPKQATHFRDAERLLRRFVLNDTAPPSPILSLQTKVATLGSCFAANIARRLRGMGVDVFFRSIGEDINNSYANRCLLDWIVDGVQDQLSADLESVYGAEQRLVFKERFSNAEVFVFTLGVAPAFFDRATGAFVLTHGGLIEARVLPQVCEFRTTSVAENVANLRHVIKRIRELSGKARIVLTVSPVPLAATYEMGSAVLADSLSKSILRVTVDELLRSGTPELYYWPSYEIVRWLGPNLAAFHPPVYGADDGNTRHVSNWTVDLIMRLFIEYFGDDSFKSATRSSRPAPEAAIVDGRPAPTGVGVPAEAP